MIEEGEGGVREAAEVGDFTGPVTVGATGITLGAAVRDGDCNGEGVIGPVVGMREAGGEGGIDGARDEGGEGGGADDVNGFDAVGGDMEGSVRVGS